MLQVLGSLLELLLDRFRPAASFSRCRSFQKSAQRSPCRSRRLKMLFRLNRPGCKRLVSSLAETGVETGALGKALTVYGAAGFAFCPRGHVRSGFLELDAAQGFRERKGCFRLELAV